MSSDKFEGATKRILCNEQLNNWRSERNPNLVDWEFLNEAQKYSSFDRSTVKLKETEVESTEQIALRTKKANELSARFKKFAKSMKKQHTHMDNSCGMHPQDEPTDISVLMNKLKKTAVPLPDPSDLCKMDEVFQQHTSNIEKVIKLMEIVKGQDHVESPLPAADALSEASTLLRDVSGW